MRIDGIGNIERMGEAEAPLPSPSVYVREVRPAEFRQDTTATGEVLPPVQVMPAVYHVIDTAPAKFPWGWAIAGGAVLFLVLRRPKAKGHSQGHR